MIILISIVNCSAQVHVHELKDEVPRFCILAWIVAEANKLNNVRIYRGTMGLEKATMELQNGGRMMCARLYLFNAANSFLYESFGPDK